MNADAKGDLPRAGLSTHVASCVIRVSDLGRSLAFYCGYGTPFGAQRVSAVICMPDHRFSDDPPARWLPILDLWATDTASDLQHIMDRMRAYDSPRQLPRTAISERLRG